MTRESNEQSAFLAILSRMEQVSRWSKSYTIQPENLNDHSLQVSIILLLIGFQRQHMGISPAINPYELASYGSFHDAGETLSEDANSLIKHKFPFLKQRFKEIEDSCNVILLRTLPEHLQEPMVNFLCQENLDPEIKELVKAADILQAIHKSTRETAAGNKDLIRARDKSTEDLKYYEDKYPEVQAIHQMFSQSFESTFDELALSLPNIFE